jgi:negative regulator of flagellin synthesis FlgM
MSDIAPVSGPSLERTEALAAPSRGAPSSEPGRLARPSDRVEFSDRARLLSRLAALPIRHELVERVRREIAAGTYETEEKLEAVVQALEEDLEG